MENIIIVILCLLVILLLAFAAYVFFSPNSPKRNDGVNIRVDGNSGLRITQGNSGVRLDIVYETYEDRRPAYDLFPDIVDRPVNDAVNVGAPSNNFWLEVASLNELEAGRREQVVRKLVELKIIKESQMNAFLYPDSHEEPLMTEFPEDDFYGGTPEEQPGEPEPETLIPNSSEGETKDGGAFKFNEFNL